MAFDHDKYHAAIDTLSEQITELIRWEYPEIDEDSELFEYLIHYHLSDVGNSISQTIKSQKECDMG